MAFQISKIQNPPFYRFNCDLNIPTDEQSPNMASDLPGKVPFKSLLDSSFLSFFLILNILNFYKHVFRLLYIYYIYIVIVEWDRNNIYRFERTKGN